MLKSKPTGEKNIAIGLDIGSTTVKVVVCNADTLEVLWRVYQRHETRQAEKVLEFLVDIGKRFHQAESIRLFCTGSGSDPLIKPLGACFVQEVNAVTLAVERLHPEVHSVIELGGQDAKIILFRTRRTENGAIEKQSMVSMNDKCASGTGATIDKCLLKAGMSETEAANLAFDATRLHHVAAKCGVFAETDIVNLIKNGIPAAEVVNSLADAIVQQNLSVLTRGNTLYHKVLLLGGPNTYLPFLVECWRLRIPETWRARGYAYPEDIPVRELIFAPDNAQFYAAFGAVVFGTQASDSEDSGRYVGLQGLKDYIADGRAACLARSAGRPLVNSQAEKQAVIERYSIPPFQPAIFQEGQIVRAVIGLDGGSTSSKAVLVDFETGEVLFKVYALSKGNPIQDTQELLAHIDRFVKNQGATLDCLGFGATGYAANVLEETLQADVNIVETIAHMAAALRYIPTADVICDIGGQDIKVLFLKENKGGGRDIRDFRLSNQCSAGNGMLLQAMAGQFGIQLSDYAETAFSAELAPKFSYGCAVFLDSDRVNFQKEGFQAPQMLAGLAQVLPKNIWQYVVQVPRLAEFGRVFVLQGGTQRNLAAVKAQVDYISERVADAEIIVHPHCGEAGAIGAAMETVRVVKRRGCSSFIGLDRAMNLRYRTRNDDSTVCHFCPNHCSRTFIDTQTPDGRTSRYISGFSCEKGTVESTSALKSLTQERNTLKKRYPNLVAEEAELAFKHFFEAEPPPEAGSPTDDVQVVRMPLWTMVRRPHQRGFQRSNAAFDGIKVGLPRVLNMYSVGPFFRTYFESLGLPRGHIIWSPPTSETLWSEGGRYGSIDPCFPSKVVQAHIHELLFHAHTDPRGRRGPLRYIYYPCITHLPSWVTHTMDTACCPIVAGSPNVIKAGFTKEVDFFEDAGIEYVDHSLTFTEPNLLKRQMFTTWHPRLGITEDESDWAVDQGYRALAAFNRHMESRGREIVQEVERDKRLALLLIGRPYHNDPGINHGIPDEFQVLGYPILSIRSIPKDRAWLRRYFDDADDPLDIRDVWPENYSANSVQKVWAARFAARHPNIALLDLSSFKCGHDAPTYGIIDKIAGTASVPYSALHDIDANKPGGSIQIRVKTYAYKLKRVEEALAEQPAPSIEQPSLDVEQRSQWVEPIHERFTAQQRPHTTILISGLTIAHDRLCCAALQGIGYRVKTLDCPDNAALRFGKEFGNRGQCNPTYYTVGNLVKHLSELRDQQGLSTAAIINQYVFLTAGACGPCRFGTYVTEYRKALRDAGFEGFRVMLFQQQGGIKQAIGEDTGLKIDSRFAYTIVRAMMAGDVINLIGYRLRPYEQVEGATNAAIEQCRTLLADAFENNRSVLKALVRCRRILRTVAVDRSTPKPVVSIIGEFWAMTTEGDGNYQLQRFLEQAGAEVDIQGVTNWLLFMLWENRHDTRQRLALRRHDKARKGLYGTRPWWKLAKVNAAEMLLRGGFQVYANAVGLHRYGLPNMGHIAALASKYYDNNVRGGEGHMEVGKLIHFVEDRVNHMTVSVKPFGCMPSSGVSDGVQSFVTARWPGALFLPIETTGDGAVNVHSRVHMMLFKARQSVRLEFERALKQNRLTEVQFHERIRSHWLGAHPFYRPKHQYAGLATNLVYAVGSNGNVQNLKSWWTKFADRTPG